MSDCSPSRPAHHWRISTPQPGNVELDAVCLRCTEKRKFPNTSSAGTTGTAGFRTYPGTLRATLDD